MTSNVSFSTSCLKPIRLRTGQQVPCGKCAMCKQKQILGDISRYDAELTHSNGYFVTLTYNNENLPSDGVSKERMKKFTKDMTNALNAYIRDFLKLSERQFRKLSLDKPTFKHVAIGEYGGRYHRPHYHLLVFLDFKELRGTDFQKRFNDVDFLNMVRKCWTEGHFKAIRISDKQHHYIAKYHGNSFLSKNIVRLTIDTPIYLTQKQLADMLESDGTTIQVGHNVQVDLSVLEQSGYILQNDGFRISSNGIGISILDDSKFIERCKKGMFFINVDERKRPIPRYIRDKLFAMYPNLKHLWLEQCIGDTKDQIYDNVQIQNVISNPYIPEELKMEFAANARRYYLEQLERKYTKNVITAKLHLNEKNSF